MDRRTGGRVLMRSREAGGISVLITTSKEGSLNSGWAWSDTSVKDLKGKVVLCREGREESKRKREKKSQTERSQGKEEETQ